MTDQDYHDLAGYRQLAEQIPDAWQHFLAQRREMLAAEGRYGTVAEKASENIVASLLTGVLDWTAQDLNWQLERADLVVTRNYMKYLVVETKRPGLLRSSAASLATAFDQVRHYADEQGIGRVAVSDGHVFRAADIVDGGLRPRALIDLEAPTPPVDRLWWLSVNGIYKPPPALPESALLNVFAGAPQVREQAPEEQLDDALLHHKYQLPARCFAYVENASEPHTWKLPYRLANGEPDLRRLPKAIQALFTNYRGTKVGGIPDSAVPAVMRRLEEAAREAGKMPDQHPATAPAYHRLAEVLAQLPAK